MVVSENQSGIIYRARRIKRYRDDITVAGIVVVVVGADNVDLRRSC